MDPGAVDSPVTLVLKAPNQKYEDQTINCFLNWTVERLKSHISNVYPSKPVRQVHEEVQDLEVLHTEGCHLRTRATTPDDPCEQLEKQFSRGPGPLP
uniref:HERPUD family member 2 n=1 Tax=Scophthalmus maximus TaxID=52904 RepID=A0A8D3AXT8_SCOMX